MGVERYVYEKLGMPTLSIVGEVSSDLFNQGHVDWISESAYEETKKSVSPRDKIRLLFFGGCDLEQLCHYIDKTKYECIADFNYPSRQGVAVHKEHTAYLRDSLKMTETEKDLVYSLPFGDEKMYQSKLFDTDYDVLVYSVLMNYTHEVYRSKSKTHRIAYGGYMNMEGLLSAIPFTEDQKQNFVDNYDYEGLQTSGDFFDDLEWLLTQTDKKIIFLNGAEVDGVCSKEPKAYWRHREMNDVLDKFVAKHKNRCKIVDMRTMVTRPEDCRDTIRHYKRTVYVNMADTLMKILDSNYAERGVVISKLIAIRQYTKEQIKRYLNSIKNRLCL